MNILFYTSDRVSVVRGGTVRITTTIATALRRMGHKCYSAYSHEIPADLPLSMFDGEININRESLEQFIFDKKIDHIILQQIMRDVREYRKNIQSSCKIYSVLHFAPGSEEIINVSFCRTIKQLFFYKNSWKDYLKYLLIASLYPIYKKWFHGHNRRLYHIVYNYSDRVVLLSNKFENEFADYAMVKDHSKFISIPNALSFDEFFPKEKLQKKKKQVLIVSRLTELQKRISLAIRIWKMIENDHSLDEWNLKIVGTGDSEKYYKKLVGQLGIQRIFFEGIQNPLSYYRDSRIFMMTSMTEGWGLTLTEAQQMGCVPIAFNSYASVSDIITNGGNGYLVKYNDLFFYYSCMKRLMTDEGAWENMAKESIDSSKRFAIDKVAKEWEKVLLNY
jgi:glycosyltransferase involved in cell wall biosynthesis